MALSSVSQPCSTCSRNIHSCKSYLYSLKVNYNRDCGLVLRKENYCSVCLCLKTSRFLQQLEQFDNYPRHFPLPTANSVAACPEVPSSRDTDSRTSQNAPTEAEVTRRFEWSPHRHLSVIFSERKVVVIILYVGIFQESVGQIPHHSPEAFCLS